MNSHTDTSSVTTMELRMLDAYLRNRQAQAERDDFELHLLQRPQLAALAEQEQLLVAALAQIEDDQQSAVKTMQRHAKAVAGRKLENHTRWLWPTTAALVLGLGVTIGGLSTRPVPEPEATAAQVLYLDQLRNGSSAGGATTIHADQLTVLMVPVADPKCPAEVRLQHLGQSLRLPLKVDGFGYAAVALPKHWLGRGELSGEVVCDGEVVANYRATIVEVG